MTKKDIILSLLAASFLALVISPFASPWPDGLERVAEDKGFLEKGKAAPLLTSPIPGYTWPGIKNEKLAASANGIFGTFIVFGAGYGIATLLKKRES